MEGSGGKGGLYRQMIWELKLEGRVGFHLAVKWEEGHSWLKEYFGQRHGWNHGLRQGQD